ncbi:hypothetical protein MD484_g5242, partial [Candolleomyces efflorescens]
MASSSAAQQAALKAIIDGYAATKYVNYLGVSGHAFVLADFLHTFPNEVRLMWPTPWNVPKVLFLGLRYYIMVHSVFAMTRLTMIADGLPTGLSPETCRAAFVRIGISSILTIVASEGTPLLHFRSPNPSSNEAAKLLSWFSNSVSTSFIAIHASAFALLIRFLRSIVSSANIVVNLAAPEGGFKFLLVQTEIDLHVILSTRMLLHLRSWAERDKRRGYNGEALTGTLAGLEYSTAVHNRTTVEYTMDPRERERRAPSPMMFAEKDEVVQSRPGRRVQADLDAGRVWEHPGEVGVEGGETVNRRKEKEKEEVVVVVERREGV